MVLDWCWLGINALLIEWLLSTIYYYLVSLEKQTTSKSPFKWRFTVGQMLVLDCMLAKYQGYIGCMVTFSFGWGWLCNCKQPICNNRLLQQCKFQYNFFLPWNYIFDLDCWNSTRIFSIACLFYLPLSLPFLCAVKYSYSGKMTNPTRSMCIWPGQITNSLIT